MLNYTLRIPRILLDGKYCTSESCYLIIWYFTVFSLIQYWSSSQLLWVYHSLLSVEDDWLYCMCLFLGNARFSKCCLNQLLSMCRLSKGHAIMRKGSSITQFLWLKKESYSFRWREPISRIKNYSWNKE